MTTAATTNPARTLWESAEERNKATIRRVFDAFVNQGDFSVVDEIYSPDMIDHQPLPGAPEGLEGVSYTIAGLREGFPDLHVTIEDMSAHGDHVVIHNTWRGTHLGELPRHAAHRPAIDFTGIVMWRLTGRRPDRRTLGHGVESNMLAASACACWRRARAPAPRGGYPFRDPDRAVRPGKPHAWQQLTAELQGPRRREYEASRRRLGITSEVLRIDPRPDGDHVIVHFETADPERTRKRWAESRHPFDSWLREQILDIHGEDPWAGPATSCESAGLAWTAPPQLTPDRLDRSR